MWKLLSVGSFVCLASAGAVAADYPMRRMPTRSALNPLGSAAVTIKVEHLHYDRGKSTIVMTNLHDVPNQDRAQIRDTGNLVRAGLNYKLDLGGAPAPVVARS